ncbi:MAG: CoA-binding protein [Patescibacteria group bacterium]|nr:CoA-binding protein [Patescibacteria group bacterium]
MSDEQIRDILTNYRTIASVGLSSKPDRPSFGVASYLKEKGYRVIPVNPNETEVLGEKAYPDLESVPEPVEIVQIFRRSEAVPEIVEAAIRRGAKVVWMQDGAGNPDAAKRAEAAGLVAVVDDCMMREHRRLLG